MRPLPKKKSFERRERVMRWWVRLTIGVLAVVALPGCTLLGSVPLLGDRLRDSFEDHTERLRNQRWAREAYEEHEGGAGCPFTCDYRAGFIDGFAHYLYHGGPCDPPPLPPAPYRALRYQSIEGYRAIEQWFTGYRAGVHSAQAGGYRQFVTGPSSLRPAAAPAIAQKSGGGWPNVLIRVDPLWCWRDWSCTPSASCP